MHEFARDHLGAHLEAAVFRLSPLVQGGALRAPRGTVSDAVASARAGRAASGRSPRDTRPRSRDTRARYVTEGTQSATSSARNRVAKLNLSGADGGADATTSSRWSGHV